MKRNVSVNDFGVETQLCIEMEQVVGAPDADLEIAFEPRHTFDALHFHFRSTIQEVASWTLSTRSAKTSSDPFKSAKSSTYN